MKKRIVFELAAGLLLSDAIYASVKRKWLPSVLFLIETVAISIVFLIAGGCTVSGLAHFNYSGGMFFLHVVNPIVFMGFYLLVEAKRKFNVAEIAWSPIFVLLYLLFDYIRFRFMGSFVYGLFPTEKMSLLNAMVIGIIMYILVGTWGLLICSVGRLVKYITD